MGDSHCDLVTQTT